uniref:Subtilisin-like protease SBT1.2 n=1 Tax=Ananas comosus var. bracteatus TaxID=296719 RepID=A0A6V7QKQ2_ANACO|nr:unnamed protein product [Ananas comosus var. bracteatus]
MEQRKTKHPFLLLLLFSLLSSFPSLSAPNHPLFPITSSSSSSSSSRSDQIQTFIVHVQRLKGVEFAKVDDRESWHRSFLPNTTLSSGEPRLIHSYREVISGFAARLSADEVQAMQSLDGFLHAHPSRRLAPLTTYTPDFLGLSGRNGAWYDDRLGKGVVVGVVDTGVSVEHLSFADDGGMPPPPQDWRGSCELSGGRSCSNKLIGAAAFKGHQPVPVDGDKNGHGTHVASVAAGSFVDGATVLGNANGTAAGMAPKAHVAVYQVCFDGGCDESDVLAGIDKAIHDGVDVLVVAIGPRQLGLSESRPRPLYEDSVAIGSFAAVRNEILTVVAAGNDGPDEGTVANDAPWALTVGAGSTDRRITATVRLGDGTELDGESAYQPSSFNATMLQLVLPGFEPDFGGSRGCRNESFDGIDIKGKIVVCETGFNVSNVQKGQNAKNAGAAAMILLNHQKEGFTTFAEAHALPAAHLSYSDALTILSYLNSSTNSTPTATVIFKGTKFGARPSPAVASFSSRGPSRFNGGIIKPDVIAPGVNILAAWPDGIETDRFGSPAPTFHFLSGTSTAAAHVAGIVALLRNSHPQWSPDMLKSAVMTSADGLNRDGSPITDESDGAAASLFAVGAGHVNASLANNPGLVYELHSHRYVRYLCGLGYTDQQVQVITQHQVKCSKTHETEPEDLNYPSISVTLRSPSRKTIKRKVKHVGDPNTVYFAQIEQPKGANIELSQDKLEFKRTDERRHFHIILTTNETMRTGGRTSVGQLTWVSKRHVVRSPIFVTFF